MIDVESITCTHYCILFTVDLVFSATCDEMSVLRAMIVTSLGFRDAQYYIMSVFLTLYQNNFCNDSNSKLYCLLLQNRNLLGTVLPLHPSPSLENTVTIKPYAGWFIVTLVIFDTHLNTQSINFRLFYCHSCLLNRLDILIQLIHKCLTFNIIHPHVKALLNNIFTSKSLTCMALDAITVFGKV